MVSSSPKASSKEMEGNALIGVDKLPKKIYKTLDESTKILRFKVPFPMFAYPIYLDSKGKEVDLSTYKGKVLLVVNVASKCGLADSNYTQLTEVYNKYKEKGFEILAFPCNQFLHQEPGTSAEAQDFACTRYKAEYPIFQKIRVNGPDTAPVYKFLKASKGGFLGSRIKWNFTKFLVDKEGIAICRYGSTTAPLAIEADIQKALGDV